MTIRVICASTVSGISVMAAAATSARRNCDLHAFIEPPRQLEIFSAWALRPAM